LQIIERILAGELSGSLNFNYPLRAFVVLGALFISACAQPLPDNLRAPTFSGTLTQTVFVGTIDHRQFILNSNKKPWFEGLYQGGFGIPLNLRRPEDIGGGIPFSNYLSGMIGESLKNSGTPVEIVTIPPGTDIEKSILSFFSEKQSFLSCDV
jgi:hypothetical protein